MIVKPPALPATALRRLKTLLLDSSSLPRASQSPQNDVAGVPGFEPGLTVLETAVLAANTIPLHIYHLSFDIFYLSFEKQSQITNDKYQITNNKCYFVSL